MMLVGFSLFTSRGGGGAPARLITGGPTPPGLWPASESRAWNVGPVASDRGLA